MKINSLITLFVVMIIPVLVIGAIMKHTYTELDQFVKEFPEGYIPGGSIPYGESEASLVENNSAYQAFIEAYGPGWDIHIDTRTGVMSYVGGQGIPLIPGKGNSLTMADIHLQTPGPRRSPTLADVEYLVRDFISENRDLIGLNDEDLKLMTGSGFYGQHAYLCFLNFQVHHGSIPIKDAIFQVRINHGNIVDFGYTGPYAKPDLDPIPSIGPQDAIDIVGDYLKGFTSGDVITRNGELIYIPYYKGDDNPFGQRVNHRLVREVEFYRAGISARWRAWVDAVSREVIKFEDATAYATYKRIHGQVYPEHVGGGESLIDRSFAKVIEQSTGDISTIGGLYPYPGGTARSVLNRLTPRTGTVAWVNEMCGSLPDLQETDGDLDWQGTTVQNCSYAPGSPQGATEAALMGIYHVTQEKITALTYLPSNTWLNNSLEFEPNYNSTCNANWDGTDLTMYRSGSAGGEPCNNTGLISGIFLHEFGHGMDDNDGIANTDYGSGEAYGDACAYIQTHNSCIGDYFWATARNCGPNAGYGNECNDCGGVRDCDYAMKVQNLPATPANWNCDECWTSTYADPCGREAHCTSAGMGEVMWDLAVRDLPAYSGMDAATAWERFARIFYESRPTSDTMYECTCPNSNGCSSDNWFRTMRVVDDDDGNLNNGTPNAKAIFEAFNRHAIACGNSGDAANNNSGTCPSITAPTLSAPTTGPCEVNLSWSTVSNAAEYRIFRNETSCDKFFVHIGTVADPVTIYTDTDVSPGISYNYRVQGVGSNTACSGGMSNCQTASPSDCTSCTIPDPPSSTNCSGGTGLITVTWPNDGTGDGYRVYRQKEGTSEWVNVSGDLPGGSTTYNDTGVLCSPSPGDVRYKYKVKSYETTNGPCESFDAFESGYCEAACGPPCTMTVDVTPDGTTQACTGDDIVFTATPSGGSGPYYYQWTEDGANIAGATNNTYTANYGTVQSHLYNCKVTDSGDCTDTNDISNSTGSWVGGFHIVDVTPDGTSSACTGINIVFTATPSGGTGPYSYQWTEDGGDIPGATNSTCTANYGTSQSHTYNCRVGDLGGCPGTVTDTADVTGVWSDAPAFAGIVSVTNPESGTCTLDLSWDPATTPCAGPITYTVYRSETTPVPIIPGNIVESDISGTTHSDSAGLVSGTTYYYVVHAADESSGGEDMNSVELSGIPTGASAIIFADDFESGNLGWTFSLGTPAATSGDFLIGDPVGTTGNNGDPCQPEDDHTPSPGINCLYSDENAGGAAGTDDIDGGEVIATSPLFDASPYATCQLDLWRWFMNEDTEDSGDYYYLEVSNNDGSSWVVLENIPDSQALTANSWTHVVFDLESFVSLTSTMRIRVRAADGTAAGDLVELAIDDIVISGSGPCATGGTCSMTVDVTPDGTTSVCEGNDIVFTATPSGGTGPYTYQWTEDGGDIAGATDATYSANYGTAQSHVYNCKVSDSEYCTDIQDASGSTGEWTICGGPPAPPVADGITGSGIVLIKVSGNTLNIVFDTGACSADHAVMLYGSLGVFDAYTGAVDSGCNVGSAGSADFDIAADNVWFNLVWANNVNDGGHPGFATGGDRTLNATGYCSVAADDHSDDICD